MAVLSLKMLALLCGMLVLCLLAEQGSCRPSTGDEEEESDYPNDDVDYEDDGDDAGDEDDDGPMGDPPTFISHPVSISLRPGDTAHLPCQVNNLGNFVLLWMNGTETLFMEQQKMSSDHRLSLGINHTLVVKGVKPEDSGTYTCQIGSSPPLSLTNKLLVIYQANIVRITPDSHKRTLKLGDTLHLLCETAGSPAPSVTWTHIAKHQEEGKVIAKTASVTINNVDRSKAGTYECRADNGVGIASMKKMNIAVNYAPEVAFVEDKEIRTGEGEPLNIVCVVHAHPAATVQWKLGNDTITKSVHRTITKENGRNILKINKMQKSDFGIYTCHAANLLGSAEASISVTGAPNIPQYVSSSEGDDSSVTLEWTVESFARITGFSLLYRNKVDKEWKTEYPRVEDPEGNIYTVKHLISGLLAGDYEAILESKNEFGKSESSLLTFSPKGKPAADSSRAEPKGDNNSAVDTRPRLLALMTVFILSAFFL